MRPDRIRHEFVEFIPATLEPSVAYVSISYCTVVHSCFCGCGNRVATPLSPTDWELVYDGETISLCPSIGNWQFPCKSHYWIRRDKVRWSGEWTAGEIQDEQARDILAKVNYYSPGTVSHNKAAFVRPERNRGRWRKLLPWTH